MVVLLLFVLRRRMWLPVVLLLVGGTDRPFGQTIEQVVRECGGGAAVGAADHITEGVVAAAVFLRTLALLNIALIY